MIVLDAVSKKSCNIHNGITQLLLAVNTNIANTGARNRNAPPILRRPKRSLIRPANDIAENSKRTSEDEQRRYLAGPPVMRLLQILRQKSSG